MPPSGDQLILKLLSQSVARLESDDRKRKQKEEEVTFLKAVKKVKRGESEAATAQYDMVESLVVYHHLREVSPKLADELSALQVFKFVLNHLKEVSPKLAKVLEVIQISQRGNTSESKKMANRKAGVSAIRFKPQEDDLLKVAIKEAGEDTNVNVNDLAKKLNRPGKSVATRIKLLKINGGLHKKLNFTLIEDTMILESLVIPKVGTEKMSELVLHQNQCSELAKHLNKSSDGVLRRWANVLQPWLLQHYSGTLNLRVERMLANYISDTFTNFSDIDWPEVAARSEFVGHTENSLKQKYFGHLSSNTKKKFRLQSDKVSPQHIAEYAELVYGEGAMGKAKGRVDLNRQTAVIDFYEKRVVDLGLENFK